MDLNERQKLVDLLFPPSKFKLSPIEEFEKIYPPRNLPAGAIVNRVAPSPTGFMHIGGIYTAQINRKLADQTNGIFILRIEDTDVKRTIPGALETIVNGLRRHHLSPDEGALDVLNGEVKEVGNYGPYTQTKRLPIYHSYAAELIRRGFAYPCFCTEKELDSAREQQRLQKIRTGYYGQWAVWRNMSLAEIQAELEKGTPFVIRFRSPGDPSKRVTWEDGVKGKISMPENDVDHVLLKSDLIPLYHFAVIIDDHLMRVTNIIRADEWLPSVPLHLQLFEAFGWQVPHIAHVSPIMKMDKENVVDEETGESRIRDIKRKLSKRKDPEANIEFYFEAGFPEGSVLEYLLNIANSDFEDWRKANPLEPLRSFVLRLEKMSASGALSDNVKLASISKEVIARLSVEDVFEAGVAWSKRFAPSLATHMQENADYTKAALNIERTGTKIAKRIATWKDLHSQLWFFYDDYFAEHKEFAFPESVPVELRKAVLQQYLAQYNPADDKTAWFDKCKVLAKELGFADNMKDFKANPQNFKGNVGDVTMIIRIALCGTPQSPDLWEVQKVMGMERVRARIGAWAKSDK